MEKNRITSEDAFQHAASKEKNRTHTFEILNVSPSMAKLKSKDFCNLPF